jgi:hypothetical protein
VEGLTARSPNSEKIIRAFAAIVTLLLTIWSLPMAGELNPMLARLDGPVLPKYRTSRNARLLWDVSPLQVTAPVDIGLKSTYKDQMVTINTVRQY